MHAYVCTQGLGTPTASQNNIFVSEKLTSFSCAPDGVQTWGHQILKIRCSTN